jgi:hypothetical protein
MKFTNNVLLPLAAILLMTATAPIAPAQSAHVRWDIATVTCQPDGSYPCTLSTGGSATAMAGDCSLLIPGLAGCSTITLKGSGSFVAPPHGGSSSAATGGGTWKVVAGDGTTTGGIFVVTELVQWQKAEPLAVPECGTCETIDNIGNLSEATGGLAVLRVAYSDGTAGVLTLMCSGLPDPFAVTEGVIASKSVILSNLAIPGLNVPPLPSNFQTSKVLVPVMFWKPSLDVNGFDINFAEFHVQNE